MRREIIDSGAGGELVLSCGHTVEVPEATGADVFCARCDALEMPPHFVAYKETPVFSTATVPAGLLRDHSTKKGVWARILVQQGTLRYHVPRMQRSWDLTPGVEGVIAPEDLHSVEPLDDRMEFRVRFFRAPE